MFFMQAAFQVPLIRTHLVAVALLLHTGAHAYPVLKCQMLQGDSTLVSEAIPTRSPYAYVPVDIRNRFRINAVVVGDNHQVEYVKIYAYYYRRGQPYLAHMAHYPAPTVQAGEDGTQLTGLQRVYAPPYGFELQYSCVLFERSAETSQ
jgi:hypothetical protein